jgi:anoctamin-8
VERLLVLIHAAVSQDFCCCHFRLLQYDGTFTDHLEMFIQLGYVVLFSSAFPMAAFCALINNLIEIRSDAFKLCFTFQRPFGQRVSNIGTWQVSRCSFQLILVNHRCMFLSK